MAARGAAGLTGLLVAIAVASTGGQALAEYWTATRLPAPATGSPNVILLVMDTVRAASLSLHGYPRETSPGLARWASRGVKFEWAMAPACWTFPSHCTFFTGKWPFQISSHWHHVLDTRDPTLAEFLSARGYQTAGFAANTSYISYESGVNRGFLHYEDYVLSPRTVLASAAMGRWISDHALNPGDYYNRKWAMFKSRDARGINGAFLGWLSQRRRADRPFFAFLNYLDAHGPYVVPASTASHFGVRPETPSDHEMLLDSWNIVKTNLSPREVALLRDSYDDCIAYLDAQVTVLLEQLDRRGVLQNTLVIVTSDHGEEFGEHNVFDHGFSLYLYESHVPLVIIPPAGPAGQTVARPVSLRDLPATIVDVLGVSAGSPFPGRSLAKHWRTEPGPDQSSQSAALCEAFFPTFALDPKRGRGPTQQGYTMSMIADGWHYIRDGTGAEALFDLKNDRRESMNALRRPADVSPPLLAGFRRSILKLLTDNPLSTESESVDVKKFRRSLEYLVGGRRTTASIGSGGPY